MENGKDCVDRKADLHMHTTYSDGALTPLELIAKAGNAGLSVISITDHDSVGALDEASACARDWGIEVVPGMELSATLNGAEVHILGYFMDYRDPVLEEYLVTFREGRLKRAERIVDKLNRMNIPLRMESVLAHATGDSVGRPHIATALVTEGHAGSYHEAFKKYIGDGRPAFEKKAAFSPEETVRLIAHAGGLSFLAHPGRATSDESLFHLLKAGIDGIEVIHPSHSPDVVRFYRGVVSEYCLLESGGSDFHGGPKGDDHLLGQVGIPTSTVDVMRHRLYSN